MAPIWKPLFMGFALILLIAGLRLHAADSAAEDRLAIDRELKLLSPRLAELRPGDSNSAKSDRFADADVFRKGIEWALRYDTTLEAKDVELLKKAVERGKQRVE